MNDCLFCAIAAGDIPADVVYRDDRVMAFRDIQPQAPTHVLVIPVEHHADLGAAAAADVALVGQMAAAARLVAAEADLDDYRLVANTGAGAGQSVFHAHLHVLGGRPLTWPPG